MELCHPCSVTGSVTRREVLLRVGWLWRGERGASAATQGEQECEPRRPRRSSVHSAARVGYDTQLSRRRPATDSRPAITPERYADQRVRSDRDREALDAHRPADLARAEAERTEPQRGHGGAIAPIAHDSDPERRAHRPRPGKSPTTTGTERVCGASMISGGRTACCRRSSGGAAEQIESLRGSFSMRSSDRPGQRRSASSTPTNVARPDGRILGTGATASIIVLRDRASHSPPPTVPANIGPIVGNTTMPGHGGVDGVRTVHRCSPCRRPRSRVRRAVAGPRATSSERRGNAPASNGKSTLRRFPFDPDHRHHRVSVDRQLVQEPERGPRRRPPGSSSRAARAAATSRSPYPPPVMAADVPGPAVPTRGLDQ